MTEVENHFTVFIRLPFKRGDFVDPPPVAWSATKERALWDVISKQSKGNEIDWTTLAEQFQVTQPFLLQQAAWLYERQLSQVRAQMRRVGHRPSATPSPATTSVSGSMVGGQAMKRAGSGGSRVPSRLSTQAKDGPTVPAEASTPSPPAKSRVSLPFRTVSAGLTSQLRPVSGVSKPVSRQASKESVPSQVQSRRGSTPHHLSRSPAQMKASSPESSASDSDISASRMAARRAAPASMQRRAFGQRRAQEASRAPPPEDDDDDEDSPPFLPFAKQADDSSEPPTPSDPNATIRGGFAGGSKPSLHRRATSERIIPTLKEELVPASKPLHSSTDSASSGPAIHLTPAHRQSDGTTEVPTLRSRPPGPLSPRQQAALAAAGLSPRRRPGASGRDGSDTSPSMGSSFSDLDDASVTQSALEEALLSNMANNGNGGMASRVSGISQALRSRYFDAQSQAGR